MFIHSPPHFSWQVSRQPPEYANVLKDAREHVLQEFIIGFLDNDLMKLLIRFRPAFDISGQETGLAGLQGILQALYFGVAQAGA